MAGGVWEAMQMPASAKASIDSSGKITVSSARLRPLVIIYFQFVHLERWVLPSLLTKIL